MTPKRALFSLCFALLSVMMLANVALAQSPVGVWKTVDDETGKAQSHIELYEKDGKLYGKIVDLLADPKDSRCDKCKGKKKDQPIIGMEILWDLKKDGKAWEDGTILDPANGKTYTAKVWLDSKDKLKVRGYIGFVYRTQTWHRVK